MTDERLLAFTRVLADSVRSALPTADTLRRLAQNSWSDRKLWSAADMVAEGKTLHEALAAQRLHPPILIALIRAGEESGKVDAFLDRYSAALETRIDFGRRLRRALVYPAFAGLVAAGLFLLFSTKAAPMLLQPIMDAGGKVPPAALKVIIAGGWITANLHWLLLGLFLGGLLLRAAAVSYPGRCLRSLAGHWLPGARFATAEARHYQFEATLELLLGAGLRPRQVMEIMAQYCEDDPIVRRRLVKGAALLEAGKTFAESLGPCLPEDDLARFSVAERAGRIDETLGKLAVEHRERHMHRLKQTATAIQLSATVALAPMCFGLIMALLWPTLAMMRDAANVKVDAGAAVPDLSAPAPSLPPSQADLKRADDSAAASRFNETHMKGVVDYMQAHKPGGADESAAAPSDAARPAPAKKKMAKIGLKSTTFQRLPSNTGRIQATQVKSRLSD